MSGDYTDVDLEVLTAREHVRRHPGIYIGELGVAGVHQLVWELVGLALDRFERNAGSPSLGVVLLPGGGCRVEDNGSGTSSDVETLGAILAHGGDWRPGRGRRGVLFRASRSLYGLSFVVVRHLSRRLEGELHRDGACWRFVLDGDNPVEPLHRVGPSDRTAVGMTFWPDPEIFPGPPPFDPDLLLSHLRELAARNPDGTFVFADRRGTPARTQTFHSPLGMADLVPHFAEGLRPLHPEVIRCQAEEADHRLDVAWQWTTPERIRGVNLANGRRTPDGGTHLAGFRTALVSALAEWARRRKIGPRKDWVDAWQVVQIGLVYALALDLPYARFGNTMASTLINPEAAGLVGPPVGAAMAAFLAADPDRADALCRHLVQFAHCGWDPKVGYYPLPKRTRRR